MLKENSAKFLNVEDNIFQRKALTIMLNELGYYDVTEACDGDEAKTLIENFNYDFIITDIKMPKTNGIELLSFLKEINCKSNVIIMTSMNNEVIELVEAMSYHLCFNSFEVTPKPCDKVTIDNLINKSINAYDKNKIMTKQRVTLTSSEFESALKSGQIINYYQPQVSVDNYELQGIEALVRWQHPSYGLLLPSDFMHFCTDKDIDILLFETVLNNAINDTVENNLKCQLSINISQKCLESEQLIKKLLDITNRYDFDTSTLTLELTESEAYSETLQMLTNLCNLKCQNIKLSIDDFGTGYSSLQKLVNYPFHELKIDRSFVSTCIENSITDTVTQMSIALGKQLGLTIVAEGVEDLKTLQHLKAYGIDTCQGFYTGKPMSAIDIQQYY
ncbi:EAL domain-containing response regulator [Shewanella psychrotolerans]|uniref:EAL domain-containing response regulator n=1 Tax=Shewanella psychrotolerans TaxID=2864206 RepID=UPI001C656410|nr:EAL domain-containing response regulator [Shewanella psychrotolerans]QYK00397.1 EAL domain-containing response regulator [Shewanella psychrotolerans]